MKLGNTEIRFELGKYSNGRIAVQAIEVNTGDLFTTVTVNLVNATCGANQAYIDTNNLKADYYKALIENNIISNEPVSFGSSGFCAYPLHNILINTSAQTHTRSLILDNGLVIEPTEYDTEIEINGVAYEITQAFDGNYGIFINEEFIFIVGQVINYGDNETLWLYASHPIYMEFLENSEIVKEILSGELVNEAICYHCYKNIIYRIQDGCDIEIEIDGVTMEFNINTEPEEIEKYIDTLIPES